VKTAEKPANTKTTVRPLGDQVLIRADNAEDKSKGGIIIPDAAKDKSSRGRVIAVGPGAVREDGLLVPLAVKEGDHVVYNVYSAQEIDIDGTELLLVKEGNILAVLEGD
jgi:chaperonin GroES